MPLVTVFLCLRIFSLNALLNSASATFYWGIICLLLFGFSIELCHLVLTGPAAQFQSGSHLCSLRAAARSWPPPLQHPSQRLSATPHYRHPPSLQGPPSPRVPSRLSPAQSVDGAALCEAFQLQFLLGHHLCCTTDLHETFCEWNHCPCQMQTTIFYGEEEERKCKGIVFPWSRSQHTDAQ